MNKKLGERLGLFIVLILFSTTFVSAVGPIDGLRDLLGWIGEIIVILLEFLAPILGDNSLDEFLFAKILLFIIVFLITYTVLKKNHLFGKKNDFAIKIIAVAIGILSIRFLEDEFIQIILLPYGALGVALTIFIPFLIYFLFLYQSGFGSYARKAGWILFGLVFLAFWIFRQGELSGLSSSFYIAGLTAIGLACVFDRYIKRAFFRAQLRKGRRNVDEASYARMEAQYDSLLRISDPSPATERTISRLKEKMEELIEEMED